MGLTSYLLGQQAARDAEPIPQGVKPLSYQRRDPVTKRVETVLARNRGEQKRLENEIAQHWIDKTWSSSQERDRMNNV